MENKYDGYLKSESLLSSLLSLQSAVSSISNSFIKNNYLSNKEDEKYEEYEDIAENYYKQDFHQERVREELEKLENQRIQNCFLRNKLILCTDGNNDQEGCNYNIHSHVYGFEQEYFKVNYLNNAEYKDAIKNSSSIQYLSDEKICNTYNEARNEHGKSIEHPYCFPYNYYNDIKSCSNCCEGKDLFLRNVSICRIYPYEDRHISVDNESSMFTYTQTSVFLNTPSSHEQRGGRTCKRQRGKRSQISSISSFLFKMLRKKFLCLGMRDGKDDIIIHAGNNNTEEEEEIIEQDDQLETEDESVNETRTNVGCLEKNEIEKQKITYLLDDEERSFRRSNSCFSEEFCDCIDIEENVEGKLNEISDDSRNNLKLSTNCEEKNIHGDKTTNFGTPLYDVSFFLLTSLEELRNSINKNIKTFYENRSIVSNDKFSSSNSPWNRNNSLFVLAEHLTNTSLKCMAEDPGVDCALVYNKDGLKIWKKEFGVNRILVRASFIAPVHPKEYSEFASNTLLRKTWDNNLSEIKLVEHIFPFVESNNKNHNNHNNNNNNNNNIQIDSDSQNLENNMNVDICYIAYKRVATLYPRDSISLRVRKCFVDETYCIPVENTCRKNDENVNRNNVLQTYISSNCSIEHPDYPEMPGKVRMDLRVGSYIATPFPTPFGIWTRVFSFNEGDPKGWIPVGIVKMLAAKVLPGSIEKLIKALYSFYNLAPPPNAKCSYTAYAEKRLIEAGFDVEQQNHGYYVQRK